MRNSIRLALASALLSLPAIGGAVEMTPRPRSDFNPSTFGGARRPRKKLRQRLRPAHGQDSYALHDAQTRLRLAEQARLATGSLDYSEIEYWTKRVEREQSRGRE